MVYTFIARYFKLEGAEPVPVSLADGIIITYGNLDLGLMLQHWDTKEWFYFAHDKKTEMFYCTIKVDDSRSTPD